MALHRSMHLRPATFASIAVRVAALLLVFAAFVLIFPRLTRAEEKRLAVYSPQTSYAISVLDHDGLEYVGLVDLLEPLGRVEARPDGNKWKFTFTPAGTSKAVEAQFTDGKKKAKLRGSDFDLPANFTMVNTRGYVPVSALANLLPRILELTVRVHQPARRAFVGGTGAKFSAELRKDPSRLVLTFPTPVSPAVATEPGKMRLTFTRDPVVSSGAETVTYGDPLISSTAFSESNAAAELSVSVNAPVLATYSEGGKVITIAAVGPQQAAAAAPPPAQTTESAATRIPQARPPAAPRFLVVIDAGHGGEERGAALSETVAEKDVTLAFARRLHRELENKGVNVELIRSTESTLTLDERAQAANAARASLYIAVHAASLGSGLRIYTALVPAVATDPAQARRAFLSWETAQAPYLDASSLVAGSIAAELNSRQLPVRALAAPLRPLNSISTAAIALELAPPDGKVNSINDAKYQQNLATAIAAGIAAIRPKLEAAR
ncbi:MAG TPA: N-acetylmuramoyl-L-alanine amidase [Clostridia bacterium]|nr:N-acetylmuramoyl-L-alanine amidase [Clostridia bacterium]